MQPDNQPPDFSQLNDTELFAERARMRERLQQLPPDSPERAMIAIAYDASTAEFTERARVAWNEPG